jgi:hypothetical protein
MVKPEELLLFQHIFIDKKRIFLQLAIFFGFYWNHIQSKKVNFALEQSVKAQSGSRDTDLRFLSPLRWVRLGG